MDPTALKKYFLLSLPIPLILTTAIAFVSLSQWLGNELGYVLGFLFYWIVWCGIVPIIYLGKDGLLSLFKEKTQLFKKENWLPVILLFLTTVVAFVMYFIPNIASTPMSLIIIAIPIAIINGTFEEILWRGLFIRAFPNRTISGFIYPTIGFAFWHISPQLIFPSESGMFTLVGLSFFLGLIYGWVAYKTGSIKWNALSHSLNGIFDFGGAIAPSIFALISS